MRTARLEGPAPAGPRLALCARLVMLVCCGAGSSFAGDQASPAIDRFDELRHDRAAYEMLGRLCDDFGGRISGSAAHRGAMRQLADELRALGFEPEMVPFTMPGWERSRDEARMVEPVARALRVAAFGYTQPCAPFAAEVVDIGQGREADYADREVRGRVGLLAPHTVLSLGEVANIAAARGLSGILALNRVDGGQLLARTGGMQGEPLPLPVLSLTQEEGRWMQRLLARGENVRVEIVMRSHCVPVETANLVVRLPGRQTERIIVGAHFDSWDLGQGAIDNGLGVAQLFALARALRDRPRLHTVELVWFSGEEQGLWGSRHHATLTRDAPVAALINLDMVGVPLAVNALGDDDLVPPLERWQAARGDQKLAEGVINENWLASDHTPFQLAGVRAVTFNAPLPREASRYYHDFADTFDKIDPDILMKSTAIIASLVHHLAKDESLVATRRDAAATRALFTRFNLERRLSATGLGTELFTGNVQEMKP